MSRMFILETRKILTMFCDIDHCSCSSSYSKAIGGDHLSLIEEELENRAMKVGWTITADGTLCPLHALSWMSGEDAKK